MKIVWSNSWGYHKNWAHNHSSKAWLDNLSSRSINALTLHLILDTIKSNFVPRVSNLFDHTDIILHLNSILCCNNRNTAFILLIETLSMTFASFNRIIKLTNNSICEIISKVLSHFISFLWILWNIFIHHNIH